LSAHASTGSRHGCVRTTQRWPRSRDRQICTMTWLTWPGHRPVVRPTADYIGGRCTGSGTDWMVAVDLSILEPAPEQPREAPVSLDFEKWAAAAGKPCLRQSCGHPHADHIPNEAMECDRCDCPRFIGFAHPDDCRCRRRHHHQRLQRPAAHLPTEARDAHDGNRADAVLADAVLADAVDADAVRAQQGRRPRAPPTNWRGDRVRGSTTRRLRSPTRSPRWT
jgi:hypothetical protein